MLYKAFIVWNRIIMQENERIFSTILYTITFFGLVAIVILRFCGIIKEFDIEYIYLLLMLSVMVIIPQFKKIAIGEISLEKDVLSVKKADEESIKTTENEEKEEISKLANGKVEKSTKEIKHNLLDAYCNKHGNGIDRNDFQENMQIAYIGDPINKDTPVFSWFLNQNNKEKLFEAKFTEINKAYYNKLYVMLSKIILHNKINKKNLSLILLIKKQSDDNIGVSDDGIQNLKNTFYPAINSGLLTLFEL